VDFNPGLLKEMDSIIEQYIKIHDQIERVWADYMVFTWHWWIDVALAVLPWILWFIVRDRKNTHNLMYAGFFTMLAATLLCMVGVSQGGWNYNTLLLPYLPEYLPWDLTIMPVTTMLFYQFFPKSNPWLKGAVFGMVAAYVIEPLFIWLGFYEQGGWEHYYSLPLYFIIYMIGFWLYSRKKREAHA
jgi:hypothetical protein